MEGPGLPQPDENHGVQKPLMITPGFLTKIIYFYREATSDNIYATRTILRFRKINFIFNFFYVALTTR
jgi:hypothetical protein